MIDSVTESGLVSQVYFIGIESMFAGYWLFGKSAGRAQILFGRLSVLGFSGDELLLVGKWQVPNKLTLLEDRFAQPHGCTISVFLFCEREVKSGRWCCLRSPLAASS